MKLHCRPTVLFALGVVVAAGPASADAPPPAQTNHVEVVDIDTLPRGDLPRTPTEQDAPLGVPAFTQPPSIDVTSVVDGRPSLKAGKPIGISKSSTLRKGAPQRMKLVVIFPSSSSPAGEPKATPSNTLNAMYTPSADAPDLEASATLRMSCGDRESVTSIRWETVAIGVDGNARLEVRDLWFDAKTCAVGPGTTTSVPLKAIAWHGAKPWLYAGRSDTAVTFIMPRTNDVSSESMVGIPVSVRGDFTRITIPLGRWGSGSIVADLPSFSLHPAAQTGEDADDHAREVGIELVKTMSEKSSTILVRTRRAAAATDEDSPAFHDP